MAYELHQSDPRVLDPVLEGTLFEGFDPDTALPRITCPTHLIAGGYEQGGLVRREDVDRITALTPRCSQTLWPELGHDIHTVRPEEYSQELLRFIRAISLLA
jgi:pimeloyl-ACP methyl ester carboxylesterase